MQTKAKIELVICTYNNATLLDRALEHLSRQTAPESLWSVLVVDNNCTDETPAVVERYRSQGRIPGLRRIVETRQGLTAARLCGVSQTQAEWIAFIDDDCFLHEDWVAQALQFAEEHPACGAFGGRNVLSWESPPSALLAKYESVFAQQDHGPRARLLDERALLAGAGMVLKREALERSGWLDEQILSDRQGKKLTSGGDEEIVLRLRKAGYALGYTPDCVLHHFIPGRRISEAYLIELFYEFGVARSRLTCQVLHESRLAGGLAYWIRVLKWAGVTTAGKAQAALGMISRNESLAYASFLRGLLAARP
jgi:glycosyltransferase involved in cell wall biosynthesis